MAGGARALKLLCHWGSNCETKEEGAGRALGPYVRVHLKASGPSLCHGGTRGSSSHGPWSPTGPRHALLQRCRGIHWLQGTVGTDLTGDKELRPRQGIFVVRSSKWLLESYSGDMNVEGGRS